jgi:hypothetical protein
MTVDRSRRAILVYATLAMRVIPLCTPTALAAKAVQLLPANIGSADDVPPLHRGPWPIRNGRNYQPTEHELRALHLEDVTPDQAREVDRLYDQLLSSSEKVRNRHRTPKH